MATPFLEQGIAYDKVMGYSKVKEPITLIITLTVSEATMDFLKPISSTAYMTIPVATRNYTSLEGILAMIEFNWS